MKKARFSPGLLLFGKSSVVRNIQVVQVNGEVILISISIQLEVDHHSMPVAGDRTVAHVYGGGYSIQSDGVVDHFVIAGSA